MQGIKTSMERLANTVSIVTLTPTVNRGATEPLQNTNALRGVEMSVVSETEQAAEIREFNFGLRRRRKIPKAQKKLLARICFPAFFGSRRHQIELHYLANFHSPSVTLQYRCVVPFDSPIFELALSGDVLGIKKLLSNGGGSLYDQDPDGDTLMDVRF